jgi:hypothetical protein
MAFSSWELGDNHCSKLAVELLKGLHGPRPQHMPVLQL